MPQAIAHRVQSVANDRPQGQPTLRIVPILGPSHDQPPYDLLRAETLSLVQVTEINAAGSVPELQVTNQLEHRVFLMDGQELVGAKQNRILNTDVLVPAKSSLRIPVSCVEQGRWRSVSPAFAPGKSASHRTRAAKHARVFRSLRTDQGHDADQGAVWAEVEESLAAAGTSSQTSALADAYAGRQQELRQFRQSLQMPQQAVGVAVFHGGRFQGLDLFDRHSTLRYFWETLVDSYALDLLATPVDVPAEPPAEEGQMIRALLDRVAAAGTWESFASPGEGREWRMEDEQVSASALVWDEQVVVHLQLFPRQPDASTAGDASARRPRIHRRYMPPRT